MAATFGLLDGEVSREEALAHAASIVAATPLPVSADLENGYEDTPEGVARTVDLAVATGLAGCSIEDWGGTSNPVLYEPDFAAERVAAAAECAHRGTTRLVLTARAENYLHGNPDLADTIARLQAYQAAGADVVYAPGVTAADDIRSIVSSVDVPVNVLAMPRVPPVPDLASIGVKRVSIGGAFSYVALGAAATAAREFLTDGTYGFLAGAGAGRTVARDAFA
jgi:2-methylisocitrate lyase-like PEP mutase family enzyme